MFVPAAHAAQRRAIMLTRTTTALLQDLADPANEDAWRVFDGRFRPILVAFGRRLGLDEEDAADAAQETLARVVKSYRAGRYDRSRGRLHSWIVGIARHCIMDVHAQRAARRERRGVSAILDLPGQDRMSDLWREQCEQEILQQAITTLRDESRTEARTIQAFELIVFHNQMPKDVAAAVGMSLNDVYLAKHRCLKRLRAIVSELDAAYEVAEGHGP